MCVTIVRVSDRDLQMVIAKSEFVNEVLFSCLRDYYDALRVIKTWTTE